VYRRPALKGPVSVAVTAAGVLVACVVGVVGVTQASARGGGAGPSITVSPSER
jgi:hypothetical protein